MPRPRNDKPYLCGPYKHRARFRVVVYLRRGDGTRDRELHSFDTRAAAANFKRGYGEVIRAAGRSVHEAVTEYLAHLERKGNKAGSIATAGYRLAALFGDGAMPLLDLRPARAQDLYDELVDTGGAVDTHHGCLVAAKAFGRFVTDQGWVTGNPFVKVEKVGKKSRGKDQLRVDEARKFTTHCLACWREDKDRTAIAALLPLLLNLRASEVSQLVARDVDDRGRLLWIAESVAKTESSRRRALVPDVLIPALIELAAGPATEAGHLFAKADGSPADRHWVSYHAQAHMAEAGVQVVTTHGLRGVHATLATVEGVTGEAVARAMGHSDAGRTAKGHYIDSGAAADAQTRRVAEALVENTDDD
jgi:integrase